LTATQTLDTDRQTDIQTYRQTDIQTYIKEDIAVFFNIFFEAERLTTRKLSYRKDDRAMRQIYGCAKKFRES